MPVSLVRAGLPLHIGVEQWGLAGTGGTMEPGVNEGMEGGGRTGEASHRGSPAFEGVCDGVDEFGGLGEDAGLWVVELVQGSRSDQPYAVSVSGDLFFIVTCEVVSYAR